MTLRQTGIGITALGLTAWLATLAACDENPASRSDEVPTTETDDRLVVMLAVSPTRLAADDQARAQVTVQLRQLADDAPAAAVEVELRSSRNGEATVDAIEPVSGTTDAEGRWLSSVRSATAGEATLTAFVDDKQLCGSFVEDQCQPAEVTVSFIAQDQPPARCTPTVAGEIVQLTDTPGLTGYPSLVAGDGVLAVAFDDDRAKGTASTFFDARQVFFARYGSDGSAQGETALTQLPDDAYRPTLVATNAGFAVVYAVDAEGSSDTAISVQRLDSSGTASGAPVEVISGLYQAPAAIATNGEVLAVAFAGRTTTDANATTWLATIDASDNVSAPLAVATDDSGDSNTYPQIASDGTDFAVAWQDRRNGAWDLLFRKIGGDGAPAADELVVRTDEQSVAVAPRLLWAGAEWGLAFSDTREEFGHYQIYLARITADGSAVISEDKITASAGNADTPGLLFAQGLYWISWVEKPWGGDPAPFTPQASSPVIDTGADVGLPYNGAGPDIGAIEFGSPWPATEAATSLHLALLDPVSGALGPPQHVADNQGFSAFPAMAWLGEAAHLIWFDAAGDRRDLHLARVSCAGQ
jgi:hypothetical protein